MGGKKYNLAAWLLSTIISRIKHKKEIEDHRRALVCWLFIKKKAVKKF